MLPELQSKVFFLFVLYFFLKEQQLKLVSEECASRKLPLNLI